MIGLKIEPGQDWLTKEGGHMVRISKVDGISVSFFTDSGFLPEMTLSRKEFRERYYIWTYLFVEG